MKVKIVIHMRSGRSLQIPVEGDVKDEAQLNQMATIHYNTAFYPGVKIITFGTIGVVVDNIDTIEYVEDTGDSETSEPALRSIGQGVGRIETLLRTQGTQQMATLAEVQADMEEMRVAAQRNADAADALVGLYRGLLAMVGDAAASATDLAGLKASIDMITDQANAKADEMVAAALETPPPAP